MKKVIIALTLPCVMLATSCSKFVDGYETSPNNTTKATGPLVLSGAELGLMSVYTGTPARAAAILTQQLGGTADQMLAYDTYDIKEGDNSNDWNNIFNNIIQPCNDIVANYSNGNSHNKGIALIVKAMALGVATDLWGDIPAQEAGMGIITGNFTPKYAAQKDVYAYIQSLLDEGITALKESKPDIREVGANDFFFEGDLDSWTNTAYILKARFAIHLSKKNASDAATQALAALTHVTNVGDLRTVYGTSTNENNQWYQFKLGRAALLRVGAQLINMMNASNDPRLSVYADKDKNGVYRGAAPSSEDLAASGIGSYMTGQTAPITLVGYVEALFIKAEANLILGKKAEAAAAHNEAVLTHVKIATGKDAPAAFVTAYASETDATITLEKIMNQKYVALFAQIESYADWRRTGFPVLTPNPENVLNKPAIPRRFPTDINERLYNPNTIRVNDILKPVWWDE
ncbi:SusD/RagB family nutrient-binding outer membrane lipoprotein [Chitinophaga sp. G-6-1-13]|uniref:SusD/RagB family nutrient-binding outer membrane lipoprotein n=1 Tax=Chitinophaga fulva TaxID=2728842 RepID=A0A848GID8_9BACT|nr:SusD/RagB family nutrient-binding outer membrane lipoprotein [Chitinophaga fulva]NML36480.1 SusD/RagB family nutrient-binding outer membrane lipoprotein [Chitinophaga fulva]